MGTQVNQAPRSIEYFEALQLTGPRGGEASEMLITPNPIQKHPVALHLLKIDGKR